jgi:hypothetical protein
MGLLARWAAGGVAVEGVSLMIFKVLFQKLRVFATSEQTILKILRFACICLMVLALLFGVRSWLAYTTTMILAVMLALLSFGWCYRKIKALRERSMLLWLTKFIHVCATFVSVIQARFSVAMAIGLPPQDFDLTVAVMAAALYIPVWFLVASLILLIVGVAQGFYAFLLQIIGVPFQSANVFRSKKSNAFHCWVMEKMKESQRFYTLSFGSLMLTLIISCSFGFLISPLPQRA